MKRINYCVIIILAVFGMVACDKKENNEPLEPLTFKLGIENVIQTGADLSVMPSDGKQTYYVDVAEEDVLGKMTDKEIVEKIVSELKKEDLKRGEAKFEGKDMNLKPETKYVFFAVGIDKTVATTEISKLYFKTLKKEETKPDIDPEKPNKPDTGDGDTDNPDGGNNPDDADNPETDPDAGGEGEFVKIDGKLNPITSEGFRHFVWDYKENPDKLLFKGDKPVIVDYWAKWCKYCIEMMPLMEQLAQEYKGRVDFFKIDTDEEVEVSNKMGISALPCFYFYPKEGAPIVKMGSMDLWSMREIIENVLLFGEKENEEAQLPEIGMSIWKGDLHHEWTDRNISVNIKCTTKNASLVKYVALMKKDIENGPYNDKELVQMHGYVLEEQYLERINRDQGMDVTFRADKDEEYRVICMVMTEEGGVAVQSKEVKTDKIFVPVVDLEVRNGAIEDYYSDKKKALTMYFRSEVAVDAQYLCIEKTELSTIQSQGRNFVDIMKERGIKLSAEDINTVNTYGYTVVADNLKEMTDYVCAVTVTDAKGVETITTEEVTTAPLGYNDMIEYPSLVLYSGLINDAISNSITCSSSDAVYAALLMLPSDELAKLIAEGNTLESIMLSHKDVNEYKGEQLQWVNGQGISNVLSDVIPMNRYTFIGDVRGKFGGRVVSRTETQAPSKGEFQTIDMTLSLSYYAMLINASAICTTGNAIKATAGFVESKKLEKDLASGKKLEDIIRQDDNYFISYQSFSAEQLEWFNQNGFVIGMTEMAPDTRYTCILDAEAKNGDRIVKRAEIKSPKNLTRRIDKKPVAENYKPKKNEIIIRKIKLTGRDSGPASVIIKDNKYNIYNLPGRFL